MRSAGALGRDDDYSVGAAHAVDRGIDGVLQHLDAHDISGVQPAQAAPSVVDLHPVDHPERFFARREAADTADSHGVTTVDSALHDHTRVALEKFLDASHLPDRGRCGTWRGRTSIGLPAAADYGRGQEGEDERTAL